MGDDADGPFPMRYTKAGTYRTTSLWLVMIVVSGINKGITVYPLAAVALHFRDNGWDIGQLAVIQMCVYLSRCRTNLSITRFGHWFAAPICVLRTALLVPNLLMPDSLAATAVGLVAYGLLEPELGLQGLCFDHFNDPGNPQSFMFASRVQNLSLTTGYACIPFLCGIAFDQGGWQLVAVFGLALEGLSALIICTSPMVYDSWRQGRSSDCTDSPAPDALHQQASSGRDRGGGLLASLPRALLIPGLMTAFAHFINIYSYQAELFTYALYFREVHNWTDTTQTSFFQMIGDVLGAVVLVMATSQESKHSRRRASRDCRGLFSRPYDISWVLAATCVMHVGIAIPFLPVAVASQTVMGVAFVFVIQRVNEMNAFLADGNADIYSALQLLCSISCCPAVGASAYFSLHLYESSGPAVPFYVAAVLCLICVLLHPTCFLLLSRCGRSLPERRERPKDLGAEIDAEGVPDIERALDERPQAYHLVRCKANVQAQGIWDTAGCGFHAAIIKVAAAINQHVHARPEMRGAVQLRHVNRCRSVYFTGSTFAELTRDEAKPGSDLEAIVALSTPVSRMRPWGSQVWWEPGFDAPDVLSSASFKQMLSRIPLLNVTVEEVDLIFSVLDAEKSGEVPLRRFTALIESMVPAKLAVAFGRSSKREMEVLS